MRTPRFEIFRSPKDEQFYFRLKAKNGRTILQSEGYTQKHNAEGGIESIRAGISDGTAYIASVEYERRINDMVVIPKYFYFTVKAKNHEKVDTSEMYKTWQGCNKGIEAVRRCAPISEIVDLTGEI